jgi:hypothetical protein
MNKLQLITLAAVSAALTFPIQAQQSDALGDFTMERVLVLSQITAPTQPNLPDVILNSLASGAIELHQVFTYNSAQRTLEQWAYIMPGKSPVPSPTFANVPVGDHYIIQVDNVSVSQAHGPTVALTGHVIANDVPTPFGDIAGAEVTLSFGYQGSGPSTRFVSVAESVSPLYAIYTSAGVGSLSANAAPQKCNVATLNGAFMYTQSGSILDSSGNAHPFADSGLIILDGKGAGTVRHSGNQGGKAFQNDSFPITYILDDTCTGTFTWGTNSMGVQASKDGKQIAFVWTSPSVIVTAGKGQLQ